MYYSVDRLEGSWAVLINDHDQISKVAIEKLPGDIAEGDVLVYNGNDYEIDKQETASRRAAVTALLDSLS